MIGNAELVSAGYTRAAFHLKRAEKAAESDIASCGPGDGPPAAAAPAGYVPTPGALPPVGARPESVREAISAAPPARAVGGARG